MRAPLLLGHRGNTPRWARRLLAEGADGVEVDVQLRHGRLYTGHRGPGGDAPRLLRHRLARLIEDLHFTRGVLLGALLASLSPAAPVMLDLKDPVSPGALLAALAEAGRSRDTVMVSTRWHGSAPGLAQAGLRVYLSIDHEPGRSELKAAKEMGVEGVSLRAPYYTPLAAEAMREMGLRATVWVVNTRRGMLEAARLGAYAVVTDKPGLLRSPGDGRKEPGATRL